MAFLRKKYIAILSSFTAVIALFSTKNNYFEVYSEENEPQVSSNTSLSNDDLISSIDSLISEIKIMKNKSSVDKSKLLKIKESALNILEHKEVLNNTDAQVKLNYILGNAHFYLFEIEKSKQYFNIVIQNFAILDDYFIQKDTYYILSKIYFDAGDFAKSEECFNQALNIVRENSSYDLEADLLICRAYDLLRDNMYLPEIKNNVDEAINIISSYKTSNQAQIYYDAGVLYSNNLNKSVIGTEYLLSSKYISNFNNDIPLVIKSSLKIGENYLYMGNFEGVIRILSPLIEDDGFKIYLEDSMFVVANLYIINAYISLDELDNIDYYLTLLDEKLEIFQGSKEIECNILTHLTKSTIYSSKNNSKKALDEIYKAEELYNNNFNNLTANNFDILIQGTLGDIYHNIENYKKSILYHENALELAQNKGLLNDILTYTRKLAFDYQSIGDEKNFSATLLNYDDTLNTLLLKNSVENLQDFEESISFKTNRNDAIINLSPISDNNNLFNTSLIFAISGLLAYSILSKLKILNLNKTIYELSNIDKNTNLYTYNFIEKYINNQWKKLGRTKTSISLIVIDIENISNNQHDEVLAKIIDSIKNNNSMNSDIIARNTLVLKNNEKSNLEEFLIVLLDTDKNHSLDIAKKIYNSICKTLSEANQLNTESMNVLIGISTMIPSTDNTHLHLINRAYESLYYISNSNLKICHINDIVDFNI